MCDLLEPDSHELPPSTIGNSILQYHHLLYELAIEIERAFLPHYIQDG